MATTIAVVLLCARLPSRGADRRRPLVLAGAGVFPVSGTFIVQS